MKKYIEYIFRGGKDWDWVKGSNRVIFYIYIHLIYVYIHIITQAKSLKGISWSQLKSVIILIKKIQEKFY